MLATSPIRSLKTLLRDYGYTKAGERTHTHTYFGGTGPYPKKLSVPVQERDAFYRAYQHYLETTDPATLNVGGWNSITEKSLPVNNMFADLDLKLSYFVEGRLDLTSGPILIRDIIDAFYEVVVDVLNNDDIAYPTTAFRMFYKCHIYFPNTPVTRDVAKRICAEVERKLGDKYPWLAAEKVIDTSVYTSGLRILGSHKGAMRKKGQSTNEAEEHRAQFGDAVSYNYYYRIGQLQDNGEVAYQDTIALHDLLTTSIICPEGSTGMCTRATSTSSTASSRKRKHGSSSRSRESVKKRAPISNDSDDEDVPVRRARSSRLVLDEAESSEDGIEQGNDGLVEDDDTDPLEAAAATESEHDEAMIVNYLTSAFAELRHTQGISIEATLHSVKRYDSGLICAILGPQACPFAGREHRRTSERGVPAVLAVLSPLDCSVKCSKCEGERIPLLPPDSNFAEQLRFTPELFIRESLQEQTHENISELIFQLLRDEFAATPMADGGSFVWHFYDRQYHRWIRREQIIAAISNRNGPVKMAYRRYIQRCKDTLPKEKVTALNKQWTKLRFNLGTTSFIRAGLLPLLARKLDYYWTYVKAISPGDYEGFSSKLDDNPRILGFRNGVWDFRRNVFRPGCPSDFISMSTHLDYVPYDDISAEVREGLEDFLVKIIPSAECLDYTLKEIAASLNGTPSRQSFFIMTGAGANGKSTLVRLLNLALGDYAGEVNITLFTHARPSADRATPEIIQIKGKRFVSCSEPNAGDPVFLGTIKWLTGGDRIVGRALRENNQSFYLQSTFFCLTNDIPPINATQEDFGTWRRIKPLCFTSRFVDNPNPDKPNEKQTDPKINEHLETWKAAFASLLVKYYQQIQTDGPNMSVPAEYQALWRQLQNRNDIFGRFVDEVVIRDESWTTVNTMWHTYDLWKRNMKIRKNVQFDHFEKHMTAILGEYTEQDGERGWNVDTRSLPTYHA